MYSKLLCNKTLNTSCKILTNLRPKSRIFYIQRQLSTLHRRERNVTVCYALKCQSNWNPNLIRYQSTASHTNTTDFEKLISTNPSPKTAENVAANVSTESTAPTAKTTASSAAEWVNESGEVIPDAPAPIVEIVQQLSANGEPTLSSLGLCNYTPVGFVQASLEFLHVNFDLPWWASIAIGTLIVRICLFPLVIKTQKVTKEMQLHLPVVNDLTQRMTLARRAGDIYEASLYSHELLKYTKKHKFNPIKTMMTPMIQAPIFISMFYGLRKMSAKVESFKDGGTLWFTDLTVPDPYVALPVLTAATLFLIIEVGSDSVSSKYMPPMVRTGLRVFPIILIPLTYKFEGAILLYWTCNNMISLCQASILRIPKIRQWCGIPDTKIPPHIQALRTQQRNKGFKKTFKESIQNFKIAREMQQRENMHMTVFRQAGKGPIIKTYDYNPKASSANLSNKATKTNS